MRMKGEQQKGPKGFEDPPREDAAKIERIAGHTAGLIEDLKAWFELKIEFAVLDFKEEIKSTWVQFAFHTWFLGVLMAAGLFGLVALAFGLGTWLGHPAWGFLAVAGLLVVVAVVIRLVGKMVRKRADRVDEKVKAYSYRVDAGQSKKEQLEKGASKKLTPTETHKLTTSAHKANNHGKDQ